MTILSEPGSFWDRVANGPLWVSHQTLLDVGPPEPSRKLGWRVLAVSSKSLFNGKYGPHIEVRTQLTKELNDHPQ